MSAEVRKAVLDEALRVTSTDRNKDYGDPEDNFRDIAELWSSYLGGIRIEAHDVAAMMVLMKIARIKTSPGKDDHWVDIAGYAACGAGTIVKPESTPLVKTVPIGTIDM